MPLVSEVLMGAGSFSMEFVRDPILEDELVEHRHLLVRRNRKLAYAGVILRAEPTFSVFPISGRGLEWWLGQDERAPLIEFRRYCAATNKLSNPDFAQAEKFYRTAEDSTWTIGVGSAVTSGDYGKDDPLTSAEALEMFVGDAMRLQVAASHAGGATGSLRLRAVYEGRFNHPELVSDPGFDSAGAWTIDPTATGFVTISGSALNLGPVTKPEYIFNGGFESGSSGWFYVPANGNTSFDCSSGNAHRGSCQVILSDGGPDTPGVQQQSILGWVAGDEILFSGWFNPSVGVEACLMRVAFIDEFAVSQFQEVLRAESHAVQNLDWRRKEAVWSVPEHDLGYGVTLVVATDDVLPAGKAWRFDDISALRVRGNRHYVQMDGTIPLVPERSYTVVATLISDVGVNNGAVWFRVNVARSGTADTESFDSPHFGATEGAVTKVEFAVIPSSGFDTASLEVWCEDIYGGAFHVRDISIKDTDNETLVHQVEITPGAGTFTLDSTVPEGTETGHWEALAERDGSGWTVTDAVFRRVCTPDTGGAIVADILLDDGTGARFLGEGNIEAGGVILADYTIRMVSNHKVLEEVSRSGLIDQLREWRVNPDFTLDWGLPAALFTDRTEVILVENDVWLRDVPTCARDAEEFVSDVRLIGAERETPRGDKIVIVGRASNPIGSKVTAFGDPFVRTHLVEDSGVDFDEYAQARAAQIAEEDAAPRRFLDLGLNEWTTLAEFGVGDWVYVFVPSAGCEDVFNPMAYRDRTVHPERLRVLQRDWELGEGDFDVEIRREDGSILEVPRELVLWAPVTSAGVQVGNPRPDFVTNEAAGAVGRQFIRFRGNTREG